MSESVNSTMNGTQPSSCPNNPTAETIGKTFAYCLIFLASLAGNCLIGIIVYRTKSLRKPINFLIVNMATSDVLYPIFVIPQEIKMLYTDSWLIGGPLGQALCKLVSFLGDVSFAVSIQSLVLIAVDRFGAVVFPFRRPLISSKLCRFFILTTWIVAGAVFSPDLLAFKLVNTEYPERLACELHWKEAFGESLSFENYYLSLIIVFTFIPLVLIAILYIIILLKLKSRKIPGEQSAKMQRLQREQNVLKMAIAILLGFAICWLPHAIGWLLITFVLDKRSCGFGYFSFVALFMFRANCAINPCICFIFSRNYRERLKTLVR